MNVIIQDLFAFCFRLLIDLRKRWWLICYILWFLRWWFILKDSVIDQLNPLIHELWVAKRHIPLLNLIPVSPLVEYFQGAEFAWQLMAFEIFDFSVEDLFPCDF